MPSKITVGGVEREFELLIPEPFEYWLKESVDPTKTRLYQAQDGLPIVFAFHGGGDDPEQWARLWPFPKVWESYEASRGADGRRHARVDCQFILVYPYGVSTSERQPVEPDELKTAPAARRRPPVPVSPPALPSPQGPNPPSPGPAQRPPPSLSGPAQRPPPQIIAEINRWLTGAEQEAETFTSWVRDDLQHVAKSLPGERQCHWNPGNYVPNISPEDDVAFVRAILQHIEDTLAPRIPTWLRNANTRARQDHVVDVNRRYGMGYSEGGKLGFKLINEMREPGDPARSIWAAFHVMAATHGGNRFAGHPMDPPPVRNSPQNPPPDPDNPGQLLPALAHPVSLYIHVGGGDGIPHRRPRYPFPSKYANGVRPSGDELDRFNDLKSVPQHHGEHGAVSSVKHQEQLQGATATTERMTHDEAADYVQQYFSTSDTIEAFRTLNGCTFEVHPPAEPDRQFGYPPEAPRPVPPYDQPCAFRWVYTRVDPLGDSEPNHFNPVVVEHRDEHMNHTNYHDPTTTNYYITVGTIWQWFFAHPRLP